MKTGFEPGIEPGFPVKAIPASSPVLNPEFTLAHMNKRKGPHMPGQAHPEPQTVLPPELACVALISGKKAAAAGDAGESWWNAKVAIGEAPQPVIRAPRFTRWRVTDVADFWRAYAEQDNATAAAKLKAQAVKASAAAKAKRAAQAAQ